jgi:glycine C-acetyltransferase
MADIFERLIKNYGPIGQHRERAHGYLHFQNWKVRSTAA